MSAVDVDKIIKWKKDASSYEIASLPVCSIRKGERGTIDFRRIKNSFYVELWSTRYYFYQVAAAKSMRFIIETNGWWKFVKHFNTGGGMTTFYLKYGTPKRFCKKLVVALAKLFCRFTIFEKQERLNRDANKK